MKKNKYFILGLALLIIYGIYYQWHESKILEEKGRYTIGTVEKIKPAGNGPRVYVSFFYKNIKEERDYIEDLGLVKKLYIGERLFIKFVPGQLSRSFDFKYNCDIPDSLKAAPPEGWDKEWMQKHFPDCLIK